MTVDVTASEPVVVDPAVSWFLSTSPELVAGVESVPGLDGKPMLFDPARGKYVALTPTANLVTGRFDGQHTGSQILAAVGLTDAHPAAARIARMAQELRQLGFLTEPAQDETTRVRASRFALKEHLIRFPLITDAGRYLEPVVAPLRSRNRQALVALWVSLAVAGMLIGGYALSHVRVETMPSRAWLLLPLLAAQIFIHETAHALVCQYYRVPVRSAGVGLMLYVMPVGYVDRTDSHRVQSRGGRVMISLAGPLSDQLWFGITGVVALTAPPSVSHMAVVMLVFQVILTVMNFNPVTPSDGYHAVTAALGIVNLRGKALALLVHYLLRTPLPAHLERLSARERRIMTGYAIACVLFAFVLIASAARAVIQLIGVIS